MTVLYYVHDPMCSWCWAFRPVWQEMQTALPESLPVRYVLGGLAPDSDQAMPVDTQAMIRRHWRTIEQRVPGTRFNHDFWSACKPRRSTWPACRAVIAAMQQRPELAETMIFAIQQAYYLQAKNPSDAPVLIDLAAELGLDVQCFKQALNASATQQLLQQEIQLSREIGASGFPSLILAKDYVYHAIALDYRHAGRMLEAVRQRL